MWSRLHMLRLHTGVHGDEGEAFALELVGQLHGHCANNTEGSEANL